MHLPWKMSYISNSRALKQLFTLPQLFCTVLSRNNYLTLCLSGYKVVSLSYLGIGGGFFSNSQNITHVKFIIAGFQ